MNFIIMALFRGTVFYILGYTVFIMDASFINKLVIIILVGGIGGALEALLEDKMRRN